MGGGGLEPPRPPWLRYSVFVRAGGEYLWIMKINFVGNNCSLRKTVVFLCEKQLFGINFVKNNCSGSLNHECTRWLSHSLNNLRHPTNIPDTFQFLTKLSEHNITNQTMVSFDVKSLFTNIPLLIPPKSYQTLFSVTDAQAGMA